MAILLRNIDLYAAYSRALPGGEIEIDYVLYYQVDIEDALEMLNAQFSPLEQDLDEFDVNFRQLTGDSGDGEYSDYGFSDSTESTASEDDDDSDDDTTDPDETEDPEQTEDSESTENTEESSEPEETDPPTESTEASTETSTETP